MELIGLFAQYNWWQLYLIFDVSYLLILNFVIMPQMWALARKNVGAIKWSASRYKRPLQLGIHKVIMNIVHAIAFPVALPMYVLNNKIYTKTLAHSIEREIDKEHKE